MAGTTRLELATSAVTGQRSNQLNYVPTTTNRTQLLTGSVSLRFALLSLLPCIFSKRGFLQYNVAAFLLQPARNCGSAAVCQTRLARVGRRNLAFLRWGPVGTSCVFRYSSTSGLWLALQFGSHNCQHVPGSLLEAPVCSGRNRGLGEMTTDYQGQQGKKLFGIGVLFFGHGFAWFRAPGIFSLLPLSGRQGIFNVLFRAEIVIGVILAAYGMLVWRSAFRKLSLAGYIIVSSCVVVFLLCVSKMTEWVYFLDQQSGLSIWNELKVGVSQITVVLCIAVFGTWWTDSTFLRERFHTRMRSGRFIK